MLTAPMVGIGLVNGVCMGDSSCVLRSRGLIIACGGGAGRDDKCDAEILARDSQQLVFYWGGTRIMGLLR